MRPAFSFNSSYPFVEPHFLGPAISLLTTTPHPCVLKQMGLRLYSSVTDKDWASLLD